jgi:hypothetical protein
MNETILPFVLTLNQRERLPLPKFRTKAPVTKTGVSPKTDGRFSISAHFGNTGNFGNGFTQFSQ